jgi:hypothetical protein
MPTIKFQPEQGKALDPNPLCFKVSSELRQRIKAIPCYPNNVHDYRSFRRFELIHVPAQSLKFGFRLTYGDGYKSAL